MIDEYHTNNGGRIREGLHDYQVSGITTKGKRQAISHEAGKLWCNPNVEENDLIIEGNGDKIWAEDKLKPTLIPEWRWRF